MNGISFPPPGATSRSSPWHYPPACNASRHPSGVARSRKAILQCWSSEDDRSALWETNRTSSIPVKSCSRHSSYSACHHPFNRWVDESDNGTSSPDNPRNANSKSPFANPCKYNSGSSSPTPRVLRLNTGNTGRLNPSFAPRIRGRRILVVPLSIPNFRVFPYLFRYPSRPSSFLRPRSDFLRPRYSVTPLQSHPGKTPESSSESAPRNPHTSPLPSSPPQWYSSSWWHLISSLRLETN
jgi:hypothetical protein